MPADMEPLNINSTARDVEDYLERFDIWCLTKSDIDEKKQTAYFLHFVGKEAYGLIKNLVFPQSPISISYTELKKKVLQHFKPINFVAAERAKFNLLLRSHSQPIRDFVLQLQTQAAKCDYGAQLEEQLRDRLIAGIQLPELQQKLLLHPDQRFQTIRKICEQYEDVKEVTKSNEAVLLNYAKRNESRMQKDNNFKYRTNSRDLNSRNARPTTTAIDSTITKFGKCASCGKNHSRYSCSYRQAKCFNCGKTGHIQSVCKSKRVCHLTSDPNTELKEVTEDISTLSLSILPQNSSHVFKTLTSTSGQKHNFIVDTGSVESIIPQSDLNNFYPDAVITPTEVNIRGITGHSLPLIGSCMIPLTIPEGSTIECHFLVSSSGPSIIGLKVLRSLRTRISLLTSVNECDLKQLVLKCSQATGGMRIPKVQLEATGDPIFLKRRIIPFGLREPVRQALESMCEKGILTPVESSNWATPIVIPLKADGITPRICGDYRITLNTRLLQRTCTTEEPEDVLYRLSGSKIFSKIDLKDAYLQIPLDETSSNLTVINTPFGLYRYNFLPFGLSVSPAVFQEVMNTITKGLDGIETYQDDIIVHAADKATHDSRLLSLLKRFFEFNVAINPGKCNFSVSSFSCLGYIVDSSGFKPDANRLAPLVNAPSPTNLQELRSILGALQYYSRFIPNFAHYASCLFDVVSANQFSWSPNHEATLRSLLSHLQTSAVLKPFSTKDHSTVITDASPTGIGAILEQCGRPVICISRRLSKTERGYSQTQREALAVYWAVKRLHKYLFGLTFTIATDHEALKFLYHPTKSLAKSSAAMVQRWSIALSSYTYDIVHRSAKTIPHVDYLSRIPFSDSDSSNSDCLLIQPLPVKRDILIADTRKYFAPIFSALRRGWTQHERRRFPAFYCRRESLSLTPDGLLCFEDRVVIPPTLRSAVLADLHSGHLGVDKMKSLARLSCWWPEMDADIKHTAKNCVGCVHKVHAKHSQWYPWPVTCETFQRVHADYCGPFLGKYYALIVIDAYSRWPEVFLTSSPSAEFTQQALRKVFSHEGVPTALVTDNGTHFSAKSLEDWLKGLGCRHLFTAPRHPQSNGLAENFVRTLKSAIASFSPTSFTELDRGIDNFLMQYRNAAHSVTGKSPAMLFKSRSLRTSLDCAKTADVTYFKGNDLRPATGIVLSSNGKRMVTILDLDDLSCHRRHIDQVEFNTRGQSVDSIPAVPKSNESFVDDLVCEEIVDSGGNAIPEEVESTDTCNPRRSERLRTRPTQNYKQPHVHSRCGGCDEHD